MKLLIPIFLIILFIKIIIGSFINGILIYPDENCFFLKAEHLAQTGHLTSCEKILEIPSGNPYPLYSIILSPIFLIFDKQNALNLIFSLNALISSLIIFPIFQLTYEKTKDKYLSIVVSILISFLPIISAYERMIMSESLFILISLYSYFFYYKSLHTNKNSKANKYLAYFLGILGIFTRPFGFIILFSILINELILSKKKKLTATLVIIIFSLAIIVTHYFLPNAKDEIIEKILSLKDPKNFLLIVIAIKNQINSIAIETLLVPALIFFSFLTQKKEKIFKKTKPFIISFISLNFIISAQHIYKYLLSEINLDLATRYINFSILLIVLYSIIIIKKSKKIYINPLIFGLLFISNLFISFKNINHALNISLSPWYKNFDGFISIQNYILLLTTLNIFLFILLIYNKKKALIIFMFSIFVIQSIFLMKWQIDYSNAESNKPELQLLSNKDSNILLIKSLKETTNQKVRPIFFDYLRLKTLTNNNTKIIIFNDIKNEKINEKDPEWLEQIEKNDYIISPFKLNLKRIGKSSSNDTIYKIK